MAVDFKYYEISMSVDYYRKLIRPIFQDRKIIVAMGVVARMTKFSEMLLDLGAQQCLLVGAGEGTGELPDRETIPWIVAVEERAPDFLTGIRNYEAALNDPSAAVIDAIEAFDPHSEALVLSSHVSDIDNLAGRPRLGARKRAWQALEDKVVIDAFWDRASVDRTPVELVDAGDLQACWRASKGMDWGAGAAWSGDAREGFNGGARYVRHVQSESDAAQAHRFFDDHCDQVRIMPFLEGVPCSVHAMVFADQTIAFRPVEMITLRRPDAPTLLYSGTSTWWDPPARDRAVMREMARHIGECLRDEVDYRGAFTVDGVLSAQGFFPTELNARSGGAFADLYAGDRRLPLQLLNCCVRHGHELDYRPQRLERLVLELADEHRTGSGRTTVDTVFEKTETYELMMEPDIRLAEDDEEGQATLSLGPSEVGGFVSFRPHEGTVSKGQLLAPLVARAWALSDELFDTEIGSVIPASSVSRDERKGSTMGPVDA